MFDKTTYIKRREKLRQKVKDGIILISGNGYSPMNYPSNTYKFRQDSSFLYYFGIDLPGLAGIIDIDNNEDMLFGDDVTLDDIIWMGPQPTLKENAEKVGVKKTLPSKELSEKLRQAIDKKLKIHFLPPYRAENKIMLSQLLNIPISKLKEKSSTELIKAIVDMRSIKEEQEIKELEKAMDTAYLMHTTVMKMAKPGVYEREIAGVMEGIALSSGTMTSFPIILSKHGETLHNHDHSNKLKEGDLLLVDAGCESPMHYATDHTRTTPVGGRFSQIQKDIYQIVLDSQIKAIQAIKPGKTFLEIHLLACEVIASGLSDLGLMKGNVNQAVEQGAHALFMPHGLGHMMGLDVHDMEDLGENYVGYDDEIKRSDIFGTAFLRLGRKLQQGFVLTVEPGIYFIPELIQQWEANKKFAEFINYDKVKSYIGFGGIRIEDDVLVTGDGFHVLGKPIPKTIEDLEKAMC